jgi:uncharacterized protein (DUF1684 family)
MNDRSAATYRPRDYLDLHDYRRQVFAHYRERNEALRADRDPAEVWERFRQRRDALFADHPQSALEIGRREETRSLRYFPYNPSACVEAEVDPAVEPKRLQVSTSGEEAMTMLRVAAVRFSLGGQPAQLALYWIDVYGGGLFLPFRDATAPDRTYGGGRYLVDTVKGSDFLVLPGEGPGLRVLLDFNYAYNPSCAYNPRWVCPLAPPENRLPFEIRAGEMRFGAAG